MLELAVIDWSPNAARMILPFYCNSLTTQRLERTVIITLFHYYSNVFFFFLPFSLIAVLSEHSGEKTKNIEKSTQRVIAHCSHLAEEADQLLRTAYHWANKSPASL